MYIKKKIASPAIAIVIAGSTLLGSPAFGDSEINFYVGAEGQVNRWTGAGSLPNKLKTHYGMAPVFGINLDDNFALEFSYAFFFKKKANVTETTASSNEKIRTSSSNIDALGYYPINDQVKLIGHIGIGAYTIKSDYDFNKVEGNIRTIGIGTSRKTKLSPRIGLGAQYSFAQNWAVRGIARYQHINQNNLFDKKLRDTKVKGAINVGVGATYTFS